MPVERIEPLSEVDVSAVAWSSRVAGAWLNATAIKTETTARVKPFTNSLCHEVCRRLEHFRRLSGR